ncbi:Alpha/Beta hydrolase protein [Zopfochytrium polystomum]|nr:Alpha/Beta hydrolase protein [Zopfochytrium polystomum]
MARLLNLLSILLGGVLPTITTALATPLLPQLQQDTLLLLTADGDNRTPQPQPPSQHWDARLSWPKPSGYDEATARCALFVQRRVLPCIDDAEPRADGVRQYVQDLVDGDQDIYNLTIGTGWHNETASTLPEETGRLSLTPTPENRGTPNPPTTPPTPIAATTRQTIKTHARLAAAAFCNPDIIAAWTCTACADPSVAGTHSITVVTAPDVGGQAFVAASDDLGAIVVAFRGTRDVRNWIEDINFAKADLALSGVAAAGVHQLKEEGKVHAGFYAREFAAREVPGATAARRGTRLGGAVATIAAVELALQGVLPATRIHLTTVGAPRVGDAGFAAAVERLGLGRMVRAVNYNDVAPHLPPRAFGFLHAGGGEVWIDATGDAVACDDGGVDGEEDRNCANSTPPWVSTSAHLVYDGLVFGGAAC